ncbi:MAG: 5'/3'-nucleotidase SurE [Candidatus Diapherotrites archaeon]
MADILLTNDDGFNAIGFLALLKELSKDFSVAAVAPETEKSWIGKSISKGQPLSLNKTKINGFDAFTVNGSPADCVQIGLYDVMNRKPKLVVSGINPGENVGHARILSSGTIGAAMEASIGGVKAIASSLYIPDDKRGIDFFGKENISIFKNAAEITSRLVKIFVEKDFGEGVDLLSVNIPFEATVDSDFAITIPFREPYGKLFEKKGGKFVHSRPLLDFRNLMEGTDLKALAEGKISITPISLELVSMESLAKMKKTIEAEW